MWFPFKVHFFLVSRNLRSHGCHCQPSFEHGSIVPLTQFVTSFNLTPGNLPNIVTCIGKIHYLSITSAVCSLTVYNIQQWVQECNDLYIYIYIMISNIHICIYIYIYIYYVCTCGRLQNCTSLFACPLVCSSTDWVTLQFNISRKYRIYDHKVNFYQVVQWISWKQNKASVHGVSRSNLYTDGAQTKEK